MSQKIVLELVADAMLHFYREGDGNWLLEAVRLCEKFDVAMPPLVAEEFIRSLQRYRDWDVKTLDEAFSVSRPIKNQKQPAMNGLLSRDVMAQTKPDKVWLAVKNRGYRATGKRVAIDLELFEEIGRPLAISASTARNYYRIAKKVLGDA